ncbi:NCS2 family permease [Fusobacterium nucleatum subsp. nucleatum ATCC 23726]|uniref:Guanine-hypoxanthine permease n=3 Tax=Fusobacterium nucleatum subsp. nucleatum TaxID=76856 RepID=Q8RHW3_FUSNN|nr:NCS2 family permease [Fusobacterium nucleatum]AAL93976.1 Guanine-hypoxanthine permease [Fusobacterium nucleatum subsp. nucleatum ATCC 25586]ALF23547.1 permease [Fusobacterium nucleatum subsp. nucleatum ChDC F316]ASG27078.1 NCS2 family permease [Fusobacterium nucleatum subsp. nucleatum]AVQ14602.1 NCS2 family permease [Fusobacterium nucleatum subsp. nucleatum ATCC 25586]AVQ22782.1 NCS2 family permease [Fusobacterium nucleatum subsp. nucleatum ATCC 23726]
MKSNFETSLSKSLEKRFKFLDNGTNLKTELIAGLTTFATMSYVLATIPNMLEGAGLNRASILTALIIFIIICSIAMALYTNRPFALAPGLSSVAIIGTALPQMNMPVEVAFGLVFLSGLIFVIISFVGIREIVVKAIPASVKISISAGIGLYISLIGLKMAGVVVANPKNNTLNLGDMTTAKSILFVIGFLLILVLEARKIKGSLILAILIVTIIGIPMGVTKVPTNLINIPTGISDISFKIDILGALKPEYFPWIFTFFVPDFFGTMGIILGIANRAGWLDKDGNMQDIDRCFKVDSLSTVAGSFFCMPVMTTYLESASGVEDGGRTGMTALFTSFLFALTLLFTPIALMVPGVATAPVLTIIGFQMLSSMKSVNYNDKTESLPAFIAVAMTIFTFNIATGLSLSVLSYIILKVFSGKAKEIPKVMYGLALVLLYYLYTLI